MSSSRPTSSRPFGPLPGFTVRPAVPADDAAIRRLAVLDDQHAPCGPLLVATVGEEMWAAVSLDGNRAVADPFRPTADIVVLLRERARQLTRARGARRRGTVAGLIRTAAAPARLGRRAA